MRRARPWMPTAAYASLAIADSVAAGIGSTAARHARYVLKPALMPTLAVAFLVGTRERGSSVPRLRTGTAAAQAFSWCGDVALLGSSERSFLTGVGSFFGSHVAYIAAFVSARGQTRRPDAAGARVALGLWLTAAPVMSVAAARRDPALGLPVAAYATILCGMFASSRMLGPEVPEQARRTLQAGTALFLLSDGVLATQKFLLKEPRPLLDAVVMATYTAGQGLIALGVARAT